MRVCTLDECEGKHEGHGYCGKHLTRLRRHGDPLVVHPSRATTYNGIHTRVMRVKGKASEHSCVDCGDPAQQWSYDHTDQTHLLDPRGPYSLDLERYQPRCIPCHRKFDSLAGSLV